MSSNHFRLLLSALLLSHFGTGFPVINHCPPLAGTFIIEQDDLFPENADWDPIHCKLYTR
jgi:hypothetical protein